MSIYSTDPSEITYPDVIRGWWAEACRHPDFLCIFAVSGFRGGTDIDEKKPEIYLAPDVGDEE
jgi:hypothetical protein